jgi:eukaryotic-like serine/threonine-protein kinase
MGTFFRSAPIPPQAMKKLGKFEIIAKVGQGAMGVVYKARDPLIDRIVALKTLTTGVSQDAQHLKRFYAEARSAGNLRHPNIVTIFELGHEGETPFIAMQFLNGESLDKIIDRMPNLPLSQKVGFIVHVCRALEHAHKQNPPVIHRDIKPANVMVAPDGSVVVVDFGIARLGESTVSQSGGLLIGTLGYMAPQLFRGATADARSDIWATGVMFYELLAYRRPFKGENAAAMMSNIILEDYRCIQEAAPGTPDEVKAVLGRMLAKDVDERYQTMEEVLTDLEPVWKRLLQSDISVLLESSKRLYQEGDLLAAKSEIVQILAWDPANTQARGLNEKISAEVRREQIVPQLKSKLENAQKLFAEGRNEEAKAEAEAALKLDSSFQPARQILSQVRTALERAREIDSAIRASRQRMAEGALTDAETQLDRVLSLDPSNATALDQHKQVQEERSSRERRKQRDEVLQRARTLSANQQYDECIRLLISVQQEFRDDPEILQRLGLARHDQSEHRRQTALGEIRTQIGEQQFDAALKSVDAFLEQFPSDATARNLRTEILHGREQQRRDKERQDLLKQRIREVERMIEREELTEAIDLGRRTMTTLGADPGLAATLQKAERELEFREEKKSRQNEALQSARAFLGEGRTADASALLKTAVDAHLFAEADPRVEALLAEIDAKEPPLSGVAPLPSSPGDPGKDYVYVRRVPSLGLSIGAEQNATTLSAAAPSTGTPMASPNFPPPERQPEALVLGLTSSVQIPETAKSGNKWQEQERAFLTAVEKHLATFLGPMAGIIANRTAAKAKDPAELLTLLAATLHVNADRKAFLARKNDFMLSLAKPTKQTLPEETAARELQAAASVAPAADSTPAAIRHASELLAKYVGPVSRILAERAAARSGSLKALYTTLAEHLKDEAERDRFLKEAGFPPSYES